MKKILFLVNSGKISPNENGGASVYYSHLKLFYEAGYKVCLIAIQWSERDVFDLNDYKEINQFVSSIEDYKIISKKPKKGIKRLFNAIFKPERFEYYFLNDENKKNLQNLIIQKNIDLVFADWRWAAIWACFSKLTIPVIYGHHDWEFKLALLRSKPTFLKKFHTFQKKRVEMKLIKKAAASISGSYTEAQEIENISGKKALYMPTTYESIQPIVTSREKPNIIHLGGMGTTANRIGLERFLDVCWEELKLKVPNLKLKVIGSLNSASNSLLEKLKDSQIDCLGFVKELDTVLYSEDIHIIPWEHNTGTRTRLPVIFNYKQVLVATKASVGCYPEITDNNSVLCNDLNEMTKEIINLYSDRERLHLLSKKGKEVFLQNFTAQSQITKLKTFINNL